MKPTPNHSTCYSNRSNQKKVTVITVCLNESNTIESTLQSVINQDYENKEYIVIDGNSNDGTIDILHRYSDFIDKLIIEVDSGLYHAMNKGVKLATGDYIIFVNGGDYFHDNYVLSRSSQYLNDYDIIYGDICFLMENGKLQYIKQPDRIDIGFLSARTIHHPTLFASRRLFERGGLFNHKLSITADYDFILRSITLCKATTKHIPIYTVIFNTNGLSHSINNINIIYSQRRLSQKKYLPYYLVILADLRHFLLKYKNNILISFILRSLTKLFRQIFNRFSKRKKQ